MSVLTKLILPNKADQAHTMSLKGAIKAYEDEMIERTHPAVLKSRQACVDANNYASVNANSPLIAKRAVKV